VVCIFTPLPTSPKRGKENVDFKLISKYCKLIQFWFPFFVNYLYFCSMNIVETTSGKKFPVEILPVERADFKSIGRNRYFFDWRSERNQELYKLSIVGSDDILGLISLEKIPDEWRIHIRLLTVSRENKGKGKKYDKITVNLIAHAAKLSVREYGELACVSLKPKSQIAQHYIDKYNMNVNGMTLSTEVPEILDLIKLYDHDE
jgi:hypothetical protein